MGEKVVRKGDEVSFISDNLAKELKPRIRELKNSFTMLRGNITAMAGLIMVLFVILIAILAPILAPPPAFGDPYMMPRDFQDPKPPFIEGHPLGTGRDGADLYYGIIWGARITLVTAAFVVFTAAFIGLMLGGIAGYYGGKVDEIIMRITDVFLSLPALILAMAITSVLSRNLENIMFALVIVWWPGYARLVRGQVLSTRENTYVEAARAVGSKRSRILFRHIIPNSISPLVVAITMDLGAVAITSAALSFIGFGVSSGYTEWGRMVSDGQKYFLSRVLYEGQLINPWWVVVWPGMMIMIFTMGCSLMGDGLRDILDPKMRR